MLTRKELMDKLTQLKIEEQAYKRLLDCNYYDYDKRTYYFRLLKKVQKEIPKIKFQIRLNKEMNKKNVKDRNTNSTNNKKKSRSDSND